MATHSSILAWIIPWTESLVGYSPWTGKESDMAEHAQGLKEMHSAWDTTDLQLTVADIIISCRFIITILTCVFWYIISCCWEPA